MDNSVDPEDADAPNAVVTETVDSGSPQEESNKTAANKPKQEEQRPVDVDAATQSGALAVGKPAAKKRSKRAQGIERLADLIAYAYSRKGQRVVLKHNVEKLISRNPTLDDSEIEHLLNLAHGDVTLAVPRQLLLVALGVSHSSLRASFREFVGRVLRTHPAFASEEMNAALNNLPDGPDVGQALAMIASVDYSKLSALPEKVRRKKATLAALRTNATYCLSLWFVETRGVSHEELAQHLFSSLWQPEIKSTHDDVTRLRLLTENRELEAVGVACESFKNQADQMSNLAARAQRGEASAQETARLLAASAEQLRWDVEARDEQIGALERAMGEQKQHYEDAITHLRDDHESLRARVLRRIREDVNLLDEGLHALQRDPPKVRVMEDHAERALDGLRSEIKQLEAEN
jgi:hypothetical protein